MRIPCTRSSASAHRTRSSCSDLLCQPSQRDRITVRDPAVLSLEELEEDLRAADLLDDVPERLRAEVEEVLVGFARVDVDGLPRAHGIGPFPRHPHRIPGEPA